MRQPNPHPLDGWAYQGALSVIAFAAEEVHQWLPEGATPTRRQILLLSRLLSGMVVDLVDEMGYRMTGETLSLGSNVYTRARHALFTAIRSNPPHPGMTPDEMGEWVKKTFERARFLMEEAVNLMEQEAGDTARRDVGRLAESFLQTVSV